MAAKTNIKSSAWFAASLVPMQAALATWRKGRKHRESIPQVLWHAIAPLARTHGLWTFPNFPKECEHVLESLGEVYKHAAQAKELNLSTGARLLFHHFRATTLTTSGWKLIILHLCHKRESGDKVTAGVQHRLNLAPQPAVSGADALLFKAMQRVRKNLNWSRPEIG